MDNKTEEKDRSDKDGMHRKGPSKTTVAIGRFGEDTACDYLISKGYKIVERNYRFRHFEIDIIAENDDYVSFVEVKTRKYFRNSSFGTPVTAVTQRKQSNVITAAQMYIDLHPTDKQIHLDIVEIYIGYRTDGTPFVRSLNHIENAYMRAAGSDKFSRDRFSGKRRY
ncbi:MAG: YraN family protein [Clostridia bacterium]|nr:YraN family protein [Clostridia bacterium]MDY3784724.1 YraN family protein [Eubacteriales bacterium]